MHYKPTVLDRFPQKDIKGFPLPDSIAMVSLFTPRQLLMAGG
jgi:hypothetical protein